MRVSLANYYLEKFIFFHPIVFPLICLVFLLSGAIFIQPQDRATAPQLTQVMKNILFNANLRPINDIQPVSGDACPPTLTPVILKAWQGTTAGCYSQGGFIDPKSCQKNGLKLEPISSQEIKVWRGYTFCISRMAKSTFRGKNERCPVHTKPCSEFHCAELNESCPVTSLSVVDNSFEISKYDQSFPLNNNLKLIFGRMENRTPITGLSVSFYGRPCLNPSTVNAPQEGINYPLEIEAGYGCDIFEQDHDTRLIDQEPLSTIYSANALVQNVSNFPGYNEFLSNNNGFLTVHEYLNLTRSTSFCHPGSYNETYVDILLASLDVYAKFLGIFEWVIYVILVLALTLGIFICYMKKRVAYEEEVMRFSRVLQLMLYLFLAIALIIQGNYIDIGGKVDFRPMIKYFQTVEEVGCFGTSIHQWALKLYNESLHRNFSVTYNFCELMMSIAILSLILTALSVIFKFFINSMLDSAYDETSMDIKPQPHLYIEMLDRANFRATPKKGLKNNKFSQKKNEIIKIGSSSNTGSIVSPRKKKSNANFTNSFSNLTL